MPALWVLSLVFLASGVSKLLSPGSTAQAFASLKVPPALSRGWMVSLFPVLELAIAVGVLLPWHPVRIASAVAAFALMVVFLVLILRARGSGESCHCFGAATAAPVTGWTVARNVLFLVLAALALAEAIASAAVGADWVPVSPLPAAAGTVWGLVVVLVAVALGLLVGRESVAAGPAAPAVDFPPTGAPATAGTQASTAGTQAPGDDGAAADYRGFQDIPGHRNLELGEDEEPPRYTIPDSIVLDEQMFRPLTHMVQTGPLLLMHLSKGCGSCARVWEKLPRWGAAIGPVRLGLLAPTGHVDQLKDDRFGLKDPAPAVFQDPGGRTVKALGLSSYPSAVLLGADGLTAGGPVYGPDAVLEFIEEIREIFDADGPQSDVVPTDPAALSQES